MRSIAVVHEILSRDTADQVDFNEILPSLVRMAEDLGSPDAPVLIVTSGDAGNLQAALATPLAVVVTELLQNAAEHAFPPGWDGPGERRVEVTLDRSGAQLSVVVADNGVGLPEEFSLERPTSLGLSIVSSLVTTQLGGTIGMRSEGGTIVELTVPLHVIDEDLENL